MCQLLKYYESESSIFLLMDYHPYGSVYPHLLRLIRHSIRSYPQNLPQLHELVTAYSSSSSSAPVDRRLAFSPKPTLQSIHDSFMSGREHDSVTTTTSRCRAGMRLSRSFSDFSAIDFSFRPVPPAAVETTPPQTVSNTPVAADKRRSQSQSHSIKLTNLTPVEVDTKVFYLHVQ